ncbi:hypothetical protein OH492_14950 [Vibrio chagasii]|nr:hypothetical protein [Vibrio chagasii]
MGVDLIKRVVKVRGSVSLKSRALAINYVYCLHLSPFVLVHYESEGRNVSLEVSFIFDNERAGYDLLLSLLENAAS